MFLSSKRWISESHIIEYFTTQASQVLVTENRWQAPAAKRYNENEPFKINNLIYVVDQFGMLFELIENGTHPDKNHSEWVQGRIGFVYKGITYSAHKILS